MRNLIILSAGLALAACGGSQKSGLKAGGDVPPPPSVETAHTPTNAKGGAAPVEPKREVSKDARKDYQAAYAFFMEQEKGHSWNESACRNAADRFSSVARDHNDLVEAQFMAGLSFERCNLTNDAEQAYQAATRMKGDPAKIALAVSSLGELYFRAGKLDGARQYWETALKATGKLVGANIGLASLELEQMRKIGNSRDANWKKLEEDARFKLSSALGVDTDSVEAYTQYALVWMEGYQTNRNRLDLAKTMLDEGKKRNEKYAPLQNAYGLYYMHKGQLNQALQAFQAAVDADPRFVEARVNAGQINLGFRKYDVAKDLFGKAVEAAPKNYDALVGLGMAQRGLNDLDSAEATYKKAISVDGRKGDAYFNLGVLYKGFRATHQADIPGSIKMYRQAKEYFQQFLDKDGEAGDKTEAKNHISDCDKVVKQLEEFQRNQANQPQPPAAPAAPAAPAQPAGGGQPSK
jgi:tetratricopeptide (TPR) repeat protein